MRQLGLGICRMGEVLRQENCVVVQLRPYVYPTMRSKKRVFEESVNVVRHVAINTLDIRQNGMITVVNIHQRKENCFRVSGW